LPVEEAAHMSLTQMLFKLFTPQGCNVAPVTMKYGIEVTI